MIGFWKRRRNTNAAIVPASKCEPWRSEARGRLEYVLRSLVILRPRAPYLEWVRGLGEEDASLEKLRQNDSLAFLIPMGMGVAEDSEAFLEGHWSRFFAQALEQIEHKRGLWPTSLSLAMMREWFDIELCEAIVDVCEDEEGRELVKP